VIPAHSLPDRPPVLAYRHQRNAGLNGDPYLVRPDAAGVVEPRRVDHITMIKRQMFGRASFPLLRKRVLLTARN
jgi:hypothetical protein